MTTEIQKLEADYAAQAARIEQLTAECVKLQEQAARELSGSWIMEKLASSAQAAAFCLEVDIPSSRKEALSWLDWCSELFTDPLPDDMTISKLDEWYTAQMRGSLSFDEALKVIKSQSPATDAALREIQAQGIKYARNRLIASFTHGFLDKPESEVRDICQMLDDAASELKNEATDDWVSETFGDEFLAAPLGVQQ